MRIATSWALALTVAAILFHGGALQAQTSRPGSLPHQGIERRYTLILPDGPTGPLPLVIALHGAHQPIEHFRKAWTMDAVAQREGFVVAYPEAVAGRWGYSDRRPAPLPDRDELADDIGFIEALVATLAAQGVADPDRVHVAGFSNGGLMAWTLACQRPDRFRAIAAMATGMFDHQVERCPPMHLVPLAVLAGTNDWVQAYDGTVTDHDRLLSLPETLEFWRRLRGCRTMTPRELPRREDSDRTRAVVMDWSDCQSNSPLRFWRIEGGGHFMPTLDATKGANRDTRGVRSNAAETAEELWSFFKAADPAH